LPSLKQNLMFALCSITMNCHNDLHDTKSWTRQHEQQERSGWPYTGGHDGRFSLHGQVETCSCVLLNAHNGLSPGICQTLYISKIVTFIYFFLFCVLSGPCATDTTHNA
jgi:hypothetical protein